MSDEMTQEELDARFQARIDAEKKRHDAAIEARNAEEAGRLADEHWRLSRDQIEMFIMPTALDLALGTFPQSSA